jgi:hypothetical protein
MVMCASHLLRIVDNVLPRETISRGAIIWLAMAAWTDGKTSSIPFDQHGMSGSLVWNTRIKEFAASGETWTPGVARLTGLLWGWDTSDRFLFATRIEHVSAFLARFYP